DPTRQQADRHADCSTAMPRNPRQLAPGMPPLYRSVVDSGFFLRTTCGASAMAARIACARSRTRGPKLRSRERRGMLRDAPPQFTDIDSLGVPRPTGAATALM